jgi:hypothetical protein
LKEMRMKTFLLLFALSLLAPTSFLNVPASLQDDKVSFTGTWKTIAGGTHQYTVILKQTDNEVTGSYSPGNGKIFDGVVKNRKLTFNWTQDGGYEGTGEFRLDEDGKGFTGSSTALKPREFTNTWNSYKPELISFAGNWETTSDGQHSIPLTIVQTGNKVTGLYPSKNGKIEGTVVGQVLRFKWESDGGSGSGRFVMDENGWAFGGTYNTGDDPDEVEATWNGTRMGGSGGKGAGSAGKPAGNGATPPVASGTNSPVSFAGIWEGKVGTSIMTWTFKQTGNQVTGHLMPKGASGRLIKEGAVTGNTLRFKIMGPHGSVNVEFVMEAGGKSFNGKFGNGPTRFVFVRP